jgi:hypothetical protein
VKNSKLAKQLKKELTRNPKKTIALGLVTVVALWFWAPLAWKWMGNDPKKAKRKAAVAAAQAAAAETPTNATEGTPKPAPAPKFVWDKLLEHMARDERMATAVLPAKARDPFATTELEEQLVVAQPAYTVGPAAARTVPLADPEPQALGLVLEGTMLSPRMQRATISGKTYRPGGIVKAVATSAPSDVASAEESAASQRRLITFQLELIEAHRVVLTRNGKQYPLVLKREALIEDEQLSLDGSASSAQP